MSAPTYKLTLVRGKTLNRIFQYAASQLEYIPVLDVSKTSPLTLQLASPHGLSSGWLARVQGVSSPSEMNTPENTYWPVRVTGSSEVEFNEVDGALWQAYEPGVSKGHLVFRHPIDLTNWVFRMHVRDRIGGTVLLSLSSAPEDTADGEIQVMSGESAFMLKLTAEQTKNLSWNSGVYDLEAIQPDGTVVALIAPSPILVESEVTVWNS